jgi:hypothetical protein
VADTPTPIRRSIDPLSDSSGYWRAPELNYGMAFRDYASYGLRQYGGWIREEFLTELTGREAARTFREMADNSSVVGSMVFAILQAMRKVTWRTIPANDSSAAKTEAEFADGLRTDMSHTWEDFVIEALSMLIYGFSAHEIVYKRRLGPARPTHKYVGDGHETDDLPPGSDFKDGRIGWRRLPIRGQDTVLKWFFDQNGQVRGLTQQPWIGTLIDLPIEKMLLFRPTQHKNNPEGKSILRNSYRSWYMVKRLEEMEAVLFERMSGFPVCYIPSAVMEAAGAPNANPQAQAAYNSYKNLVTNTRVNEQMGALLPSDVWTDADGKVSNVRMFEFKLETPQHGRGGVEICKAIDRHKLDMLMTVMADFIQLGHDVRGTNNLAVVKTDMFFQALEGWLSSIAEVLNRYALPRLWAMNALPQELMPHYSPDMPQRLDLDSLGMFVANLAQSGMPLFPDEELQEFLREAAGMPEITDPSATSSIVRSQGTEGIKKLLFSAMVRQIKKNRGG